MVNKKKTKKVESVSKKAVSKTEPKKVSKTEYNYGIIADDDCVYLMDSLPHLSLIDRSETILENVKYRKINRYSFSISGMRLIRVKYNSKTTNVDEVEDEYVEKKKKYLFGLLGPEVKYVPENKLVVLKSRGTFSSNFSNKDYSVMIQ